MRIVTFSIILLLIIPTILSQEPKKTRETFGKVTCREDGSISFTREPRYKKFNVERVSDGKIFYDVPGEWIKTYIFESEKLTFTQPGSYVIKDSQFGDNYFTCPGVQFHCSLINYSISSCRSDENRTIIELKTIGTTSDQIRLKFLKIDDKLSTFESTFKSKDVENLSLILLNNRTNDYLIEIIKGPVIKEIQVTHQSCTGDYYPHAEMRCNYQKPKDYIKMEVTKICEEKKNMDDFLECILSSETKYDYTEISDSLCNFLSVEPDICRQNKKKTQSCLFLVDEERINCAKSALDINDIIVDGLQCNNLQNEYQISCFNDLRNRIYELILFRFTVLEFKSINMLNQNYLNLYFVKEFIVKTEKSKKEFKSSENKQERQKIIKEVRKNWQELLGGLGK